MLRAPAPADLEALAAFYISPARLRRAAAAHRGWKEFAAAAAGWMLAATARLDRGAPGRLSRRGRHLAPAPLPPSPRSAGWVSEAEGRGIAREAARALRDWAYARRAGHPRELHRPGECRSIRLAERLGAWLDPEAAPETSRASSTATPGRRRCMTALRTRRRPLRRGPASTDCEGMPPLRDRPRRATSAGRTAAATPCRLRRRRRAPGAARATASGRSRKRRTTRFVG